MNRAERCFSSSGISGIVSGSRGRQGKDSDWFPCWGGGGGKEGSKVGEGRAEGFVPGCFEPARVRQQYVMQIRDDYALAAVIEVLETHRSRLIA